MYYIADDKKKVQFAEEDNVHVIYSAESVGDEIAQKIVSMPFKRGKSYDATILTAASLGDNQIIQRMLSKYKSCANACNRKKWTPLMYASQKGNYEACKLLLQSGCKHDAQNDMGRTALMLSSSWGHAKVTDLLLQYVHSINHRSEAVAKVFKYVNMRDNTGKTALHYAVAVNQLKCMDFLLSSLADPLISDHEGKTPLSIAEETRSDAYKELLKHKR